ncbi:hypothetical protein A1QO_02720 [Vibrio genomosp. F10 str. ZF-129]|uniref:Uncharacterized protein n=1 Tax=Vibrio genomosp. F10 str. ZF-129 TaxID=1187848 RepID=A0A1E5BKB5_9VIBR|nr:hypothetical protein [Vibrio genomosp. F10]OEE38311.1 hypothetical protein A1QO_02720 [Vibrio genomosp. F10 str. ZF-129]
MTEEMVDPKRSVENLRERLKQTRKQMGGSDALFIALYGKEPEGNQDNTFRNLVNRGSLKAEFVALCAEKLEWHDVTLSELFALPERKK